MGAGDWGLGTGAGAQVEPGPEVRVFMDGGQLGRGRNKAAWLLEPQVSR